MTRLDLAAGPSTHWYGVYPARVADVKDPDNQGRVKILLPWAPDSGGKQYEAWARVATLMAGDNRGTWFIPDTDDEVVVAFAGGDPRKPYVLGSLWNGKDSPPESMDAQGRNEARVIKSRNGSRIALEDTDGQETITLETPGGAKVVLRNGPSSIVVEDGNGNSVKLESIGVTVNCSAKVKVNAANAELNVNKLTVDAGMSEFSGVIKASTVIADSIVAASYTPGAGNIS
jgi:uncharacterized protein involved in type VI secretion and phage assembly